MKLYFLVTGLFGSALDMIRPLKTLDALGIYCSVHEKTIEKVNAGLGFPLGAKAFLSKFF